VNLASDTVRLTFHNTVFHVRSANPADSVRYYTVEPGKRLAGTWTVTSFYFLSVYGPNGFFRCFTGSVGSNSAALDIRSHYRMDDDRPRFGGGDDRFERDRSSIKLKSQMPATSMRKCAYSTPIAVM
jgi:hypothetical protein